MFASGHARHRKPSRFALPASARAVVGHGRARVALLTATLMIVATCLAPATAEAATTQGEPCPRSLYSHCVTTPSFSPRS